MENKSVFVNSVNNTVNTFNNFGNERYNTPPSVSSASTGSASLIARVKAYDRRHRNAQTMLYVMFPQFVKFYPENRVEAERCHAGFAAELILSIPGLGCEDEEHPHNKITGISTDEMDKLYEKRVKLYSEQNAANPFAQMVASGGGRPPSPLPRDLRLPLEKTLKGFSLLNSLSLDIYKKADNSLEDSLKFSKFSVSPFKIECLLDHNIIGPLKEPLWEMEKRDFTELKISFTANDLFEKF